METLNLAKEFFELYAGLPRAHGLYKVGAVNPKKNKVDGKAETVSELVTIEKWHSHLSGGNGIGVIPIRDDATVRWGAIDIDVYPLDLNALFDDIVRLNLPLVVIRTKSGGAHLTCFCNEDAPASTMRSKLVEMAVALGYPNCEIFPKQVKLASERDVGNWLNMPYYDHENTTRYAIYKERSLTAAEFVKYAKHLQLTAEQLEEIEVNSSLGFDDGPPCLQLIAREGIQPGARNDSLFAFGVYCRNKYGDDWKSELEKMNHQLCDPPLPAQEMTALEKSLSRKNYAYPCNRRPCVSFCNKEVCNKREFGVKNQKQELGVTIGPLVKINYSDEPVWIVDVDGVRFEVTTAQMISQVMFKEVCLKKTNIIVNIIPKNAWEALWRERLENLQIIEPPPEASEEGDFIQYFEQFLRSTAPARVREELLLGKPWTDEEGWLWFRSVDLNSFLARQHFKLSGKKKTWGILSDIYKAKREQMTLKGTRVRVWGVPAPTKQEEAHATPDFQEKEF